MISLNKICFYKKKKKKSVSYEIKVVQAVTQFKKKITVSLYIYVCVRAQLIDRREKLINIEM